MKKIINNIWNEVEVNEQQLSILEEIYNNEKIFWKDLWTHKDFLVNNGLCSYLMVSDKLKPLPNIDIYS